MKFAYSHLLTLMVTLAAGLFLSACTPATPTNTVAIEEFAKCLTTTNTKMYGAYWCPHCADQKALFGKAFGFVTYVECSLPNKAGETKVCTDAKVEAYPTWEFADGSRTEGVLSFATLAQKTGCPDPTKPQTAGPPVAKT